MSDDLIKSVQELIDSGKGDIGRLNYILNTLRQRKPLFSSDQKYVEKLLTTNRTEENVRIENDFNELKPTFKIDDPKNFSESKNLNNISKNRKSSAVIGGGIGTAVAIIVLLLVNTGNLSIPNNQFVSQLEFLNPAKTYKINTECELIYFLYNGPQNHNLSLLQSPEEFQKKYPEEAAKLKKLGEDPKFVDQLVNAQRSVDDPFDKIIYPYEMREVLSSILIKEFSINPQLKNKLTILQGIEITPQVYREVMDKEHGCEEKMKANPP